MEKSQPKDTTGAGPGKQGYTHKGGSDGVHPTNKHSGGKPRQDGVTHKDHVEAHTEAGWKYKHSTSQGPIKG